MEPDLRKSFVTFYLESLLERTRSEKTGAKWGLDWVIYNIGLSVFGKPVRLPFLRSADGGYAKSKSEAEFGVDVSFLSDDHETLTVFVLKDEPLTNRNWTDHDFLRDLQLAMSPDLDAEGLAEVKQVTVVLAYNKDEEKNGVELYELFVRNAPKTLREKVALRFERWNLSDLVEKTLAHVLTPALVPQKFFGQLSYLCAQAADFSHGSDPWEQQLIPGWKRFLKDVLEEGAGERGVALVPVALIILRQHADKNPSIQTGLIDLTEWAAIALWCATAESQDIKLRTQVIRFWIQFYIGELERFYTEQMPLLAVEQSIDQIAGAGFVGAVAASWVGYWHLGRLGLLSLAFAELMPRETPEEIQSRREALNRTTNWTAELINANVCLLRPMLDIQHIEIYLMAMSCCNAGRAKEMGSFFEGLIDRLYLRRLGASDIPFLDGHNSLESVFEQVAVRSEDKVVASSSSYFVLMLLELSCILPPAQRDNLLASIHRRLVLGAYEEGDEKSQPIDLISWMPPADWELKVLRGYVDDGEAVSVQPFAETRDAPTGDILAGLENLVRQMRQASKLEFKANIPLTALILASLRHRSPLPPDLWRIAAFPEEIKNPPAEPAAPK